MYHVNSLHGLSNSYTWHAVQSPGKITMSMVINNHLDQQHTDN